MEAIENNQVALIENSIEVFRTAPEVLLKHQARASKALVVADNIIQQWTDAFAVQDPAERILALGKADERSMKFLANCSEASTQMKESRAAITQLMDMLRKMYTVEENSLDPKIGEKPNTIQNNRNLYAVEVLKETERLRKVAEAKAAKEKEANDIRHYINSTISRLLYEVLAQKKLSITEKFNNITLDTYEEKAGQLQRMPTEYPQGKQEVALKYDLPKPNRHDDTEMNMLQIRAHGEFDFQSFYSKYNTEISELKNSLVDRLPSKLAELQTAKAKAEQAEKERLAELERQRQAQIQRDKDMAKANAEKKKQLEEENRLAQEREQQRIKDMEAKAEQERTEAQRLKDQREVEERERLAKEAEENRLKAEQEADLKKAADNAMTMFNETAEVASNTVAPETRSAVVITVKHPAAWVELMQFWYTRNTAMPLEEMEKMTFEKLRKYAEKAAGKGEKIESKFMTYGTAVTAVNRKVK